MKHLSFRNIDKRQLLWDAKNKYISHKKLLIIHVAIALQLIPMTLGIGYYNDFFNLLFSILTLHYFCTVLLMTSTYYLFTSIIIFILKQNLRTSNGSRSGMPYLPGTK